jgi:hypothetical protein
MSNIRRIAAVIATVVSLIACTGTALAGPFNLNGNGSYVRVPPESGHAITSSPRAPTLVRVVAAGGGFNWGDAGIGAAAGLAIPMIVAGGGLALTERRAGGGIRNARRH